MPRVHSLARLFAYVLIAWALLLCLSLLHSSFVGRTDYGGKVSDTKASKEFWFLSGAAPTRPWGHVKRWLDGFSSFFAYIGPDNGKPVLKMPLPPERIKNQEHPRGPGEMNAPVVVKEASLSENELAKYKEGWQNNAFNEYVSDMISVHRSMQDFREADCLKTNYTAKLPKTSVILIFYNEAWSVLLRSVHSILDRSPPDVVEEIILVDDFSTRDYLKQPLDSYMADLPKVKILRSEKRNGLIRARMLGASSARGEVLLFLDSHIETTPGWLEPLLHPIALNWTVVTVPMIDAINDDTFHISAGRSRDIQVGGFNWNLIYTWHVLPMHVRNRMGRTIDPTPTPTMAGGLFAISAKFFNYLGQYDPGLNIWGGENLELSFKVWMCGGSMYIVPCSHVGHIFRKRSPYSWGSDKNVLRKNLVRLAEVWLDEYKLYYYMRINFDLGNYGDVRERKALRKTLKCKSFDWYLKNVYPDLFVPRDAVGHGEIRNKAGPHCLDAPLDDRGEKPVILYPCHGMGGNQVWLLSNAGEFRRDTVCLDYPGGNKVITFPCHGGKGNQHWEYQADGHIYHRHHRRCLAASVDFQSVVMRSCINDNRQLWIMKRGPPTMPERPPV